MVSIRLSKSEYDVVICGAGLAGLTLARHLRLKIPKIQILILDKVSSPLPTAAMKVGESTVEVGAFYLSNVLQLTNYFEKSHLRKLGLRYFFGDAQDSFKNRPEFGLSEFPPVNSYQIDRGVLENDLRKHLYATGVELIEDCFVQEILLSQDNEFHNIAYIYRGEKTTQTIKSRWVIDAMGRRRFLQKKLGIAKASDKKFSAAWFRIDDRIDVSDFVASSEKQWHDRVPNNNRYYSTNHLVGHGYWIWLIPLSSGYTSIGIVTTEEIHPFSEYSTYERAYEWLDKYEPILAFHLRGRQPVDFLKIRNYSHSSSQIFSQKRWACVGDASVFSDPFYSPGTVQIGFANSLITELVALDLDGTLTPKTVDEANQFCLSYNDGVTQSIQANYSLFAHPAVMAAKLIWDFVTGWAFSAPLMFNSIFLEREKSAKVRKVTGKFVSLSYRVQNLFLEWSTKSLHRFSFSFIDYLAIPFVRDLRLRNLKSNKTEQEIIDDHLVSMETVEELAQVIFLLALEDTMPDVLAYFPSPVWLNAWGISLNMERWETDRLFKPSSKPRNIYRIMAELQRVFLID